MLRLISALHRKLYSKVASVDRLDPQNLFTSVLKHMFALSIELIIPRHTRTGLLGSQGDSYGQRRLPHAYLGCALSSASTPKLYRGVSIGNMISQKIQTQKRSTELFKIINRGLLQMEHLDTSLNLCLGERRGQEAI